MKGRYYVTLYNKYPIYEPAEGGYYYEGREISWSFPFQEYRKARRFLKKCFKDCVACKDTEDKYWHTNANHSRFGVGSKYIGEGWYVVLERKQGSEVKGWEPYC